VGCNNEVHVGMINTLYDEIVLALSAAAKTTIPQLPTRAKSFKTLPGWNTKVKEKHSYARSSVSKLANK